MVFWLFVSLCGLNLGIPIKDKKTPIDQSGVCQDLKDLLWMSVVIKYRSNGKNDSQSVKLEGESANV